MRKISGEFFVWLKVPRFVPLIPSRNSKNLFYLDVAKKSAFVKHLEVGICLLCPLFISVPEAGRSLPFPFPAFLSAVGSLSIFISISPLLVCYYPCVCCSVSKVSSRIISRLAERKGFREREQERLGTNGPDRYKCKART